MKLYANGEEIRPWDLVEGIPQNSTNRLIGRVTDVFQSNNTVDFQLTWSVPADGPGVQAITDIGYGRNFRLLQRKT